MAAQLMMMSIWSLLVVDLAGKLAWQVEMMVATPLGVLMSALHGIATTPYDEVSSAQSSDARLSEPGVR